MSTRRLKESIGAIKSIQARTHMLLHKIAKRSNQSAIADASLERAWRAAADHDVEIALRYGDLALRRSKIDSAIEAFTRATATKSQGGIASYKLGFALERSRNWVAADAAYQEAQSLMPDAGNIAFRRGRCLNESGNLDDASAQYRIAIRGGHRIADAYSAVYAAESTAPLWKRLDTLRAGTKYHLSNAHWLTDRAVLAARMGEHAEAIEYFLASDALASLNRGHKIDMARSYQELGRTSQAAELLSELAASDEGAAKFLGPGAFFKDRGYWSEAIALFQWKLRDSVNAGQQARIEFEIGHAFDRQYLWHEAREWFQRSLVSNGSIAYRHYRLGVVLERLHEYDEAIGPYAAAVQISPSKLHWYYRLGTTARKAGKPDVALRALQASLGTSEQPEVSGRDVKSAQGEVEGPTGEFLQGLGSAYVARLDRERHLVRSASVETWQESLATSRTHDSAAAKQKALHELAKRKSHISNEEVAEYVRLLEAQGAVDEALDALQTTRDVQFPDGLDLKKYLKHSDSRRRALFAEYQESLELKHQRVFLESNHGSSLGCHPLALFREMTVDSRFAGFTYVWAHAPNVQIPDEVMRRSDVILVTMHSDLYLKYLATSKYLVNNVSFAPYFVRRSEQVYLNTWHGTPLKALGRSMQQGLLEYENLARNFVQATHVSSPNELTDWALFNDHRIARYACASRRITGSPRLDRLICSGETLWKEVRRQLGVDGEETLVLYAPTWRGGVANHEFDTERLLADLNAMAAVPGIRLFFRAHRLTEKLLSEIDLPVEIVPSDLDTNDLLAGVDILVTDYSSIGFDFLPTGRPVVFYTPDFQRYTKERGLYLSLDEFPGWTCSSTQELVSLISRGRELDALDSETTLERFSPMEDGSASRRTIDFMLEPVFPVRSSRPLLVFHASLIPNGISSALLALFYALDPNEVNIVLVVEGHVMRREEGRQKILERLPEYVDLAFRIGEITATPEELWAIGRDSTHDTITSEPLKKIRGRAWERETRRVLGPVVPETAIEFDGYATLWADFMANMGGGSTRHLIWQHNQLVNEWRTKYPELAELFSRYDDFDLVIPVAEALSDENRVNLVESGFQSQTPYAAVPNVLDYDRIARSAEKKIDNDLDAWLDEIHLHVVTIGRLSPEKNFRALVDAWPEIVNRCPLVRLTIIGTGLLEAELQGRVDELDIRDSVFFAGQRANPYPALKRADLFVLPSVHEGQPVVILEAMSLGVPIAAAYTPGTAELVEKGYGFMIDCRAEGLAADILSAIRRPEIASGSFDATQFRKYAFEKFCAIAIEEEGRPSTHGGE